MLDINLLRNNFEEIKKNLQKKGFELDEKTFERLDSERKRLQIDTESLQEKSNILAKEVAQEKNQASKDQKLKDAKKISTDLKEVKAKLDTALEELNNFLLEIPNVLSEDVPDGKSEENNQIIYEKGTIPEFSFKIKDHQELGELSNGINFEESVTIAKSRFVVLRKEIAKLHRALVQYMLDVHIENGYEEIYVPYLVNKNSLVGTGQLPKFEEDLFKISNEEMYLIPTAEVPVSNIHRNKILNSEELPINFVAHTPCFRSEAGSYGKDTKGIIRQHQFDKVELVKFVHPEDSENELDKLTNDAESILNNLNLPYRKVILCSGDTGFASSKTFDLEVWFPSQKTYREISSCSNFRDFQSRRMKIRIKQSKGNIFCHTINGSGLAIGRTLAAILENNQTEQGSVIIPEVLVNYMGGTKELNLPR
ncbi:serine--tRNA ligase [Gammaproteobacteria bacterium]|nr:serine--tRNA ligase [Gammaproteobacteria bacterium]